MRKRRTGTTSLFSSSTPRSSSTWRPIYVLLDEKGPDHNKCFESEVVIDQRHFPSAWAPNKKEAEQKAAYNALVELGVVQKSAVHDLS